MTDLSRLIDNLCAGLEGPDTLSLSTSTETLSTAGIGQSVDNKGNFHTFQSFHSENKHPRIFDHLVSENANFGSAESRVASSYVEGVETAERVETEPNSLAGSTSSFFPLSLGEVERLETEAGGCEHFAPDLNHPAPPPPGDPLPISEVEVRAGVARELRVLGDFGRTGPDALRDAIEIVAAKIRNSAALVESQSMDGRCHVCREPLDGTRPEVAVMQGKPGSPLHIHSACHGDHKARRTALVDRIMAAAGYGPAQTDGEAA